jgi:hypothetical protein
LRVLGALISATLGAAALSIYRKDLSGLSPGACLGWYIWFAFTGAQCGACLPAGWLAGPLGAGALYVLGRLPAFSQRRPIDIPADARILIATSISFLLRGSLPLGWTFAGFVPLDVLVFGFVLSPRLLKPPHF